MRKFLRVSLFVAVTFASLVYGRLAYDVGQPYLGVVLGNWTADPYHYEVDPATPSVWQNVQMLPPGTWILGVDGEPVDGVSNVALKAWQAGRTEVTVSYVLPTQSNTDVRSSVVPIQLFSWFRYIELVFQFGFAHVLCFLLAISLLNMRQNFDWRAIAVIVTSIFFMLRQDDHGMPISIIHNHRPVLPIDYMIQIVSRFVYGGYWFAVIILLLAFPYPNPKIEHWLRMAGVFTIMTATILTVPYMLWIMGLYPDIAKQWDLNALAVIRKCYAVVLLGFFILTIRTLYQHQKYSFQQPFTFLPLPVIGVLGALYWSSLYEPSQENLFLPQVSNFLYQSLQYIHFIKYDLRPFHMLVMLMITSAILRYQTFHALDPLFLFTTRMIISCCLAALVDLVLRFLAVGNKFWIAPIIPLFFVFLALSEYMSHQFKTQGWMWRLFNRHLILQQ
ncbi:MAG: hypothetical protein KGS46_19990, partial [Chloroflexi bacterium]|nr:hypothetical protein [Chloroflexota bacterium]